MRITERHTPAAVGWRASHHGTEWELCWIRGSTVLVAAFRRDDGTWSAPMGMDPDRWGHNATLTAARATVCELFEKGHS